MSCLAKNDENLDRLLAYSAGKLDMESTLTVERHLRVCPECAEFYAAQRGVWNALDAWEVPAVSEGFDRRLFERIEKASAAPWYLRWVDALRPLVAQPALPLALATLVVATGFLLDHPSSVRTPSRAPAIATAADAEQIERTLDDLEMLRQFDAGADDSSKSM
jgi:anti-sigma factor RsiW